VEKSGLLLAGGNRKKDGESEAIDSPDVEVTDGSVVATLVVRESSTVKNQGGGPLSS
jgi:hypothetical protein